jgi:hypothetical protein
MLSGPTVQFVPLVRKGAQRMATPARRGLAPRTEPTARRPPSRASCRWRDLPRSGSRGPRRRLRLRPRASKPTSRTRLAPCASMVTVPPSGPVMVTSRSRRSWPLVRVMPLVTLMVLHVCGAPPRRRTGRGDLRRTGWVRSGPPRPPAPRALELPRHALDRRGRHRPRA